MILLRVIFTILLIITSSLRAQEVVVDAGGIVTLTPAVTAASYAWSLNGVSTGRTTPTYRWSPERNDTGVHWLKVDLTQSNGTKSEQHWRVRVRIPLPVSSIAYYVATDGADDNTGGIDDPFATMEKARDVIRALPRPLPKGGVTVYIRGGTYRRTGTFNLSAADSGADASPIIWRSYGTEVPVFTTARALPSAAFTPLDPAMVGRLASGVAASNIKQVDLTEHTFTYDGPFPTRFNQSRIYNPYLTSQDGGLFEVFYNGSRAPLSRYPNDNLSDRFATPNLMMDGVTRKYATTVNGEPMGGQFKYKTADEARISRWQTAAAEGGLWIQGFFRVPWEEYGMKVKAIDTVANTITLAQGASMSLGLGNKYYGYEGSKTEPYWALNLLEEIDQPGEWAVDFRRKRLYLWPSGTINNSNLEISDFGSPIIRLADTSHLIIHGLEFRRSLGQGIVVSGGEAVTVMGCTFRQLGSYAVDLDHGYSHGVVSCDISDMASGGVYVRGGDGNTTPRTQSGHFVVNNDIEDIAKVVKIYAAGIDAGFGGQAGNGGGGGYKPSVGTRVASNRIAYTHHVGILHGSLEKTLEYNLIDNFCRTNGDMGGIYSFTGLGGDDTIRFNQMTNKAYSWEPYFPKYSIGGSGLQFDLACANSKMYGNIIESIRTGISCNVGDEGSFYNNVIVNNQKAATSIGGTPVVFRTNVAALGQTTFGGTSTGTNKTYPTDPGFVGRSSNDYRLKMTSAAYKDLTLFREIPVEMIGLYQDETRTTPTNRKPLIDNPTGATSITQNSATLNGQMDFPFINPDTTVRIYWGTSDGGTSAASWQNNVNLGIRTRGKLAHPLSGLAAKTKYFYRYYASNSAGGSWASASRSFTTGSPLSYKANNTTDLSSTGSWTNGAVPIGGMAVWNTTVTAANAVTIGSGVSLLGIEITNPGGNVSIAPGTSGSLGLGSGGLDLSSSSRTLTISAPIVLNSDQTWISGNSGGAASTQITVSGNISGDGELRIEGAADRAIALTGINTFSGGLVLDTSGRLLAGTTAATSTTNVFGTGPLTIYGGILGSTAAFGLNEGISHPLITVHGDFTLSPAGRMMVGGMWDLGGDTRVVACTRGTNSGSALQSGGNTSWGIGTVGTRSAVVSDGTLRVTRDGSLGSAFISFRLHGSPEFIDNAGLAIGPGVVSVLAGALANPDASKLPDLTVDAGGYFSLSEDATPANAAIGSLSGDGEVGNFTRSASVSTATLTIDGGLRSDVFVFSGKLADNNPSLSTLATMGKLNVVKTGSTTQVLAGTNTYTGTTDINGGVLVVNGSLASPSPLTVSTAGRLAGSGSIASPSTIQGTLEPTGSLVFSSTLAFSPMARMHWNLLSNAPSGHPLVTANAAVSIAASAGLRVELGDSSNGADFSHSVWRAERTFTLLTAPTINGTFTLDSVSADVAGNSHESFGFFAVENTGTALNLRWFPIGSADGWRFTHFGTTSNTGDAADVADPDGDGFSNQLERAAATDPNDAGDYPGITWINTTGPAAQLWSAASNWSGNQIPLGQENARLDFLTGIEVTEPSLISTNDLPGDFPLNRMVLAGSNPDGVTDFQISGNPLRFIMNGAIAPRIDFESSGAGFTVSVATPIQLDAPVTVNRVGDASVVLAGAIEGTGSLVFQGDTGNIRLTGNNTWSGGIVFPAGTLNVGHDGPTGSLGSGPVVIDGQLRIDRTGELVIPGSISGSGGISIYNPGAHDVVTLSGNNSFVGSVTVGGGGLRVRHSNALGTTIKSINVQTSDSGSLRLDGSAGNLFLPASLTLHLSNPNGVLINEAGNNRINGPIILTSYSGDAQFVSGAGMMTLAGNITPSGSGRGLILSGTGNGILLGNLAAGGGGVALAGLSKSDTGTWTIAGTSNNISGTVVVHGGILDVTGSLDGGRLSVASDGTFSGNGTFAAADTVNGILMPATTTFSGPLGFGGSSTLAMKTTGNANGMSGRVNGGTVSVANGAKVTLVFNAPGSMVNFQHVYWRSARSWTLLSSSNQGITGSFTLDMISPDAAGQNAAEFGTFTLHQTSGSVVVSWSPIPGLPSISEPLVSRISPTVSPVALTKTNHAMRVAASASGGGTMSWAWSKSSGPGVVTFADPTASDTFATFSTAGRYILRASASNAVGTGFVDFTVDVEPVTSFSLREGVNGYTHQASFVRADTETWNSGARDSLVVGKTSAAARTVFSFGVSSIPRTWPVASVSLDLWTHPTTAGSGTIGTLHLRRMTRSITEGTGDGASSANGTGTGVDWLKFNGYNSWTTPGGDFEPSALTTLAGFNATTTNQQRSFGSTASFVSALNASMTAGSAFNLVVLAPATESDTATGVFARFAADDHPTEAVRPRLTVQFAHNFAPSVSIATAPVATAGVATTVIGSATNATSVRWSMVSGPSAAIFENHTAALTRVTFSEPGAYVLRFSAANASGESGLTLAVTVAYPAEAKFANWQSARWPGNNDPATIGPSVDPDRDGMNNLLEWGLMKNPIAADGFLPELLKSRDQLSFTYTRRKTAPGEAVFTVEWSDTLGDDWSSAGVVNSPPVSIDANSESVTTNLPAGENGRRFIRIRLTKP